MRVDRVRDPVVLGLYLNDPRNAGIATSLPSECLRDGRTGCGAFMELAEVRARSDTRRG
jgi:hypothetical protein